MRLGELSIGDAIVARRPHARAHYKDRLRAVLYIAAREAPLVAGSKLSSFLLHYLCCEVAARLLQGMFHDAAPLDVLESREPVRLQVLEAALKPYHPRTDRATLYRLFYAKDVPGQPASARRLREKVVHGLSITHVTEVEVRAEALLADMRGFLRDIERIADML